MVKGRGCQTNSKSAIPQLRENSESPKQKKVWKVLFDSGSDGDIAFIYLSDKSSIKMQNRLHPQRWKTSNGIFETHKVGIIKLNLPRFSTNKVMSVTPDIQFIEEPPPNLWPNHRFRNLGTLESHSKLSWFNSNNRPCRITNAIIGRPEWRRFK